MTAALSAEQRSSLEKLVQRARQWIVEDLEERLAGTFGIDVDGRIEEIADLSLSNAQALVRADLVEVVEFLRSEGEDQQGSVARLVREAAFTHVNRLIAVRVAEAIGLLPETMAKGTASSGFQDFSEVAPTVAMTEWGRFAEFLRLCADELAADVPALFDPRNPFLDLAPSEPVLAKVVEAVNDLGDDLWAASDTLGWAYQFFNTDADRRQARYRPDGSPKAPESSQELAVRNQFFTPNYVVEFLVHNGLGAYLAAGFPGLADELELLVEVPSEQIEVDLDAVSVLDPACGSGHFLLGAYDVLERAWQHAGVDPAESAPAIVRSLWGIDIDPRATQIAQAAVMFRARRHCRDRKLPSASVVCARSLPSGPEIDAFIASLPAHVARAVRGIAEELIDAPILGPLLKIEERLDREVRDVFGTGVVEGTLSETADHEPENIEAAVLDALSTIADSTTSTASQRIFAAEAHDAVRFVEAMSRRYTAVLMNPPFGEPVPSTKVYLKAAYPWIPARTSDLLTAFVGRGVGLSEERHGTCSAVTSRAGLFLSTFEKWRSAVLLDRRLSAVADLGYGVMEQALVEAAAYVIQNRPAEGSVRVLRLLKSTDRPRQIRAMAGASREGTLPPDVFDVQIEDVKKVPRSPLAYWVPNDIRRMFDAYPPLSAFTEVRQGLATGDDFRYVRALWEIAPERLARSVDDTRRGRRWVPFAKGGEYSPSWASIELVVDWENDGERIRQDPAARPQNTQFFFEPGLTWTLRTASAFGARVLPRGCIFSNKGNIVFGEDALGCLPWINSRVGAALLALQMPAADETTSGGASKSYEVGTVARVPVPQALPSLLESHARRAVNLRRQQQVSDERSTAFLAPELQLLDVVDYSADLELIGESLSAERVALSHIGASEQLVQFLDDEVGRHPGDLPLSSCDPDVVSRLYVLPMQELISTLIAEKGGARNIASLSYVADRRLEVLAHGCGVHPSVIASIVAERRLEPPDRAAEFALRFVSYLVGLAFGRWSVGEDGVAGSMLSDDVFEEVRLPWNLPASSLAPSILVDQPGHPYDLAVAVSRAATSLPSSAAPLAHVVEILRNGGSLRDYLGNRFFLDHLARYTTSRRRAPIYWQLQVPSKTWGIWLYAPKLSREMLFAIVRETEQRQRLAEQQIAHLQREAETGSGGRKASEVAKELEAEQRLAVELASFRAEAERIANLGWEPDLDDGMVLNAAPLADLFPAWKDAAAYRKELRAGKYEWATVAHYADQL